MHTDFTRKPNKCFLVKVKTYHIIIIYILFLARPNLIINENIFLLDCVLKASNKAGASRLQQTVMAPQSFFSSISSIY